MRVTRLYAGQDGESHFEEIDIDSELRTSPTGVVAQVSPPLELTHLALREVVTEASDTEPHVAPESLLIVTLTGTAEVTVSDGETRIFGPGSAVLVQDTFGKGHITNRIGTETRRTLVGAMSWEHA
jgi:hypothetical protein